MSKKILVIDDNEQDREILKRYLSEAGYKQILDAEDGKAGLKKAKEAKPALVIVDTLMPGLDGFEVCRRLKESQSKTAPKVIIMTGSIDAVDAVQAREGGADDYCVKTSDCAPLLAAVKKLI